MNLRTKAAATTLALLVGGCGGMLNGTRQTVRINTIPPGARVTVDGRKMKAPVSIDLLRDEDHQVTVEANGFEPKTETIESQHDSEPGLYNCLVALCIPQLFESERLTHFKLVPEKADIHLDPIGWSPR